jgi:L,D-transpeptidase ErfK/SrfK
VISKVRNPSWYVPQSVLAEHKADGRPLPRIVPPGPDNPLGEYAMRLGLPGYLIHGTNRPAGVGMRVTHGCVRMFPEDIEFLFGKIDVNTTVRIINEPIKMGWSGNDLVMEVHPVLEVVVPEVAGEAVDEATDENTEVVLDIIVEIKDPLTYVTEQFIETTAERAGQLDWQLVEQLVNRSEGIPTSVGRGIKNAATSAAFE